VKRIEYVRYRNWSYPYSSDEDPQYTVDKEQFFAEQSEEFADIKTEHKLYNGWWVFRHMTDRIRWIENSTPSSREMRRRGGSLNIAGNKRGLK